MFNGKTNYKWPFSMAMLNYQRVLHGSPQLWFLKFQPHKPWHKSAMKSLEIPIFSGWNRHFPSPGALQALQTPHFSHFSWACSVVVGLSWARHRHIYISCSLPLSLSLSIYIYTCGINSKCMKYVHMCMYNRVSIRLYYNMYINEIH